MIDSESDVEDDEDVYVPDQRGIQEYRHIGGMGEVMDYIKEHANDG